MGFMPLAMGAISAVSTASQISSQNKALKQQQDAAVDAQKANLKQSEMYQQDLRNQVAEQLTNLQREGLRNVSSIEAQQSATGLSGASMRRQQANVFMQEAFNAGSIVSQGKTGLAKAAYGDISNAIQTQSQVNQLESQKTSGLSAALQIGMSGYQGYMAGSQLAAGMTGAGGASPMNSISTVNRTMAIPQAMPAGFQIPTQSLAPINTFL